MDSERSTKSKFRVSADSQSMTTKPTPWMLSGYAKSNDSYQHDEPCPDRYPCGRAVIPRKITVNDQDGPRGSTITVVGKGFRNSLTATVWNDEDGNGRRDPAENDLTTALTTGSDDFTATVTITNPPFSSIYGHKRDQRGRWSKPHYHHWPDLQQPDFGYYL